ncbi:Z1 domain-containing protein [Undibacterium sp. TC4M20W]|uniref:Z1 domain-containing protein n=1 Tax=Undibacterium sp. TC4M20W TaxID=3413052 RepID=UPI003BF25D3E
MATSVKILNRVQPPLRWVPVAKDFTDEFLKRKASDPNGPSYQDLTQGDDCVLLEAQRILGRCLPPNDSDAHETGLVVGYVQSGKTMSFETVISLARDNGYGIVIVLAGTKNNLKDQSEKRLKKDLGIDDGEVWHHYANPAKPALSQIENKLSAWRKDQIKRRAVLITVLKQKDHLDKLVTEVLRKLSLAGVPVLIIDDEGDQASLNTKASKNLAKASSMPDESSTIYDRICAVRDAVPHHSYLQYTATPQANLLLAQTDLLNPSFAELVTPGGAYTGGQAFFKKPHKFVVEIPPNEVPSASNTLSASPKSLLSALRYFLLAAAHHSITRIKGKDRNRSMMVHPAMQTTSHRIYKQWMDKSLKTLISFVEKQSKVDPDAVARRFQVEYDSLAITFPSVKPLAELIDAMVEDVFSELNCVEVNSTADAEKNIDWRQTPYWILVGGNKLDRGYTVEGLCSTYMPRPLGKSPAADTLQQRARFFGYKKNYLGLCRVFVQSNVISAFTEYVEHENFIRKELEAARGKPLRDWRRDFLLTTMLRPTRPNVVGLGVRRILVDGWMVPGALQRDNAAVIANQALLIEVKNAWSAKYGTPVNAAIFQQFKPAKGDSPNFIIESVPLLALLEDFFLKIQVKDPVDAEEHSAMLIALTELMRNDPNLKADVFLMNNLIAGYRTRDAGRGWPAGHPSAPINQYFSQSAGSVNDRDFCSNERVSLQLRAFDLGKTARGKDTADVRNVTWYALNVPKKLNKGLVIQDRS